LIAFESGLHEKLTGIIQKQTVFFLSDKTFDGIDRGSVDIGDGCQRELQIGIGDLPSVIFTNI